MSRRLFFHRPTPEAHNDAVSLSPFRALFGVYLWRSNGFKLTRADEIAYRGSLMSTADLAPASNVDEYGSDEKDKEIEHLESVRKA